MEKERALIEWNQKQVKPFSLSKSRGPTNKYSTIVQPASLNGSLRRSKANSKWSKARIKLSALYKFRHAAGQPPLRRASTVQFIGFNTGSTVFNYSSDSFHWWILCPNNKVKTVWNVILALLLLYTALVMPVTLAFIDIEWWDPWFMIDLVIDALFSIDVLVNLVSAYTDRDGNLVTSQCRIILHYAKTWMFIDILACIPFGLFEGESSSESSGVSNDLLRLLRLPRLYRLLRITRLVKMLKHYRNSELLEQIQEFLSLKHSVVRLLSSCGPIWLCIHLVSCLWYYTAKLEGFHPDTWVVRGGYQDLDVGTLYVTSLYWCFTTVCTVGYGDIVPHTNLEKIVGMAWMLFSIYVFSFTIGSLTTMLSNIGTKESALAEKLAAIDEFAGEANLGRTLRLRLKHALRYSTEKSVFSLDSKNGIFNDLPRTLKREIVEKMYSGAINKLHFFVGKDQAAVSDIVPFLNPVSVQPSDLVYEEGEDADEIYFVIKGNVAYLTGKLPRILTVVCPGEEFGDIEVVFRVPRKFTTKAEGLCEFLVMTRALANSLEVEHFSVWKQMKITAKNKLTSLEKLKIRLQAQLYQEPITNQLIEDRYTALREQEKAQQQNKKQLEQIKILKKKHITTHDLQTAATDLFQQLFKLDKEVLKVKQTIYDLQTGDHFK